MVQERLKPGDPRLTDLVIEQIHQVSREEWLQQLRARPDFDESWVLPEGSTNGKPSRVVRSITVRSPLRTISRR